MYRINGFEQIKAFYSWVFNNPDKVRPTHISLYLFLLNQNNRSNWVEWFKCPYDLAMQGACIGNNGTYYKCLDELKQWKLIDYQKGVNNFKAPLVKLFVLYDNEHVTVPLSEQVSEQQTVQQCGQQYEQLPVHIYKLITDNLKPITDKYSHFEKYVLSLSKKEPKKQEKEIPTFDEFYSYILENDKTVNKDSANLKYKSWIENGWKDGNDRPVKNWKSKILNTIQYLQKDTQHGQSNYQLTPHQKADYENWASLKMANGSERPTVEQYLEMKKKSNQNK